jgi:progressive ankylosis protein
LAEFVIIYWGFKRYIVLTDQADWAPERPPLTYRYLLKFFWPLALVMFVQELSRPLINLFIARGPDGTVALAVLSISYALGQWPYRWLNEIRNLPPAFHTEDPDLRRVRRFAAVAGLFAFALSVVLFWTPLRDVILLQLVGVEADLAAHSHLPLMLYSFFAFVVMIRAYLHGVGLLERRTHAFALSAPARILAILILLIGLPFLGVTGATLGVAALLGGFAAETLALWWGVRGRAFFSARAQARALSATPGSD